MTVETMERPITTVIKNDKIFSKCFDRFKELCDTRLITNGGGLVALVTHPYPDPDAMACQVGLAWMLNKIYGVECRLFVGGEVSHPQNLTMVNLLGIKLIPIAEYKQQDYAISILVDVIPSNASARNTIWDIIVDHHLEVPTCECQSETLFINLHTGSCASTVHMIMKSYGVEFDEDSESDQNVATAMLIGIRTDTDAQTAERTTQEDHKSYSELFPYRNPAAFQKICKFKRPRDWVQAKASAIKDAKIQDGVAIVGLGMLTSANRDLIADMADEMLTWQGCDVAVAFAVIDGEVLQASIRSSSPSVSAAKFANDLAKEKKGEGWGHSNAAGYKTTLGALSIHTEEDDEALNETWNLIRKRETWRILQSYHR